MSSSLGVGSTLLPDSVAAAGGPQWRATPSVWSPYAGVLEPGWECSPSAARAVRGQGASVGPALWWGDRSRAGPSRREKAFSLEEPTRVFSHNLLSLPQPLTSFRPIHSLFLGLLTGRLIHSLKCALFVILCELTFFYKTASSPSNHSLAN